MVSRPWAMGHGAWSCSGTNSWWVLSVPCDDEDGRRREEKRREEGQQRSMPCSTMSCLRPCTHFTSTHNNKENSTVVGLRQPDKSYLDQWHAAVARLCPLPVVCRWQARANWLYAFDIRDSPDRKAIDEEPNIHGQMRLYSSAHVKISPERGIAQSDAFPTLAPAFAV